MKAKFLRLATMFLVACLAGGSFVRCAKATSISGAVTADNAFFAYISTSNSVRGTLVASGNDWGTTFTIPSFALTPGQTYYLQIEAINYGGPGAIIGDFTLSDAGFQFANGSQHLLTNTANWLASFNDANANPAVQQPWVTPTGGVTSQGANGVGPWGTRSGISGSADWIDVQRDFAGSRTGDVGISCQPTGGYVRDAHETAREGISSKSRRRSHAGAHPNTA
jgi:hypothetical protein